MSADGYYALARAAKGEPIACGLCRAGKCGQCIGKAFNQHDEPCPCKEAGHG